MLVNGEMQIARFSFSAFRFTEQQNQTVSTYYLHCITRLCEISTCSTFRVKTFNLYFAFILFVLELANYNLYKLTLGKLETPFGLGWVGCCMSLSIYSGFAKLCYFGGDLWTKQKKKATYTLSSPTQRQTLAKTLFRLTMLYGSFHSNVANEKGETLCLWPPLLLQMESQNPKSSHHQPSSYVQIMVRSFPFVKTKWIIDLQHYWDLSYLHFFPDLRNWLFSVYFISVVATKEEGELLQLTSFTYKACNICPDSLHIFQCWGINSLM